MSKKISSRDEAYRRLPPGSASHPQQQQQQQPPQQQQQQQVPGQPPTDPAIAGPQSKLYYPIDPRRRQYQSDSKIPQPPKFYPGRDHSPDKAAQQQQQQKLTGGAAYQSQPLLCAPRFHAPFPKTNPMATPGDSKRYQQQQQQQPSSYELHERVSARREERPRTCPPDTPTGPPVGHLLERSRTQERLAPPSRLAPPRDPGGPANRIGPPERLGPPDSRQRLVPPSGGSNEQKPAGGDPPRVPPPPTEPPGYPTQLGPRLSDDELLRYSPRQLLDKFRRAEAEIVRLMVEHGQNSRELSRQLQNQTGELRSLQEAQRRLQDENQELRDLCCFLDDDRQKGRKLAREWQRFGRYTASVMRQEVSAYQSKLRELDNKQHELVKDNLELKELCLYLDEERQNHSSLCSNCGAALNNPRDEGDGSSSSTAADEYLPPPPPPPPPPQQPPAGRPRRTESQERLLEEGIQRQRNILNEHILQYIRSLERRLEVGETDSTAGGSSGGPLSRPDAVVQAMRVLEVQEHLDWETASATERPQEPEEDVTSALQDPEKALVRQMCSVVWRKLEEIPSS